MNLIYNINFDIAALVCLVIIEIYLNIQYIRISKLNRIFHMAVVGAIMMCITDIASVFMLTYVSETPFGLNVLTNSMYFVFEGIVIVSYIYYVRSYLHNHGIRLKTWVRILDALPLIGGFLLICVNPFTGWLFRIDLTQQPVYIKGILYSVVYIVPLFYFVRGIIMVFRYGKFVLKRDRITITLFVSAMVITICLQVFFFTTIALLCFAVMISVLMMLITLETPEFQRVEQTKKDLEIAKEEAEEADRTKSVFLMNMSHEIRTPINGVLGMNALILKQKDLVDEVRDASINIQNSGKALLSIINDILDVTKISSGEMELICNDYRLDSMINDAYQMVVFRAEEKALNLNLSIDPSIPVRLYGDGVRVRQIIVNLLTNAVKYTEKGWVHWTLGWDLLDDGDINLKIIVEDSGIGISKENKEKLFTAFERFDTKRNRNIEGTGLGLRITKKLVDLMGGTIQVESEYGIGSKFTVVLPQKVDDWEVIGLYSPHAVNEKLETEYNFSAEGTTILLVDDVPINLRVIRGLLRNTGITIDTASSGIETLEKTVKKKYDIIFLDHMMPGMDGMETMRRFTQIENNPNENTPVVMLTANAIVGAKEEYLEAGFKDYLSKPVKENELRHLLVKYLPAELVKLQ